MPTLGVHSFVFIGEWDTASGNEAIRRAGEIGFDVIEIPMLKPDIFDWRSHRAALEQAGVRPTCTLALPAHLHLPAHPEEARAFLGRALQATEAVGSPILGGCIAYSLGVLTGKPPEPSERQIVAGVLRDVAAEAKARGITLGLEACNRYETYLYNTLADTRDTIRAVGVDNLMLHADTYHMNIEENNFRDAFVGAGDVLGYVHMSESHRGLVGSGTVKWDEVWQGLQEIDFGGYLVLESFAAINPDLTAATCLWRPPAQSPQTIAAEGLAFLRAGVEKYGLRE
jgi:D-psicose/D-tagatose/L-ribulose 3-epimerase